MDRMGAIDLACASGKLMSLRHVRGNAQGRVAPALCVGPINTNYDPSKVRLTSVISKASSVSPTLMSLKFLMFRPHS